jgi:signal transduction histidine kinase
VRVLRLLLIEDSEPDAALLAASLVEAGFALTMTRVETAVAMSEALREGPWDVVIADYTLPQFDADRALALFNAAGLDAPFIVLSGTIGEERAGAIVRAGAHDFVLKGGPRSIVQVVERELREGAERRARRAIEARLLESEHRRLQEQEANRLKDELLAVVSHELRNPLNAILGWSVLAQELSPPPDVDHALVVIERNARAQAKLIDDLLDVARMRSGTLRSNIGQADVGELLRAAVDAIAPTAAEKRVALRLEVAPDVGSIAADGDRLQQIAANLLTNAVKFTPEGGHAEITARRVDQRVVIVVRDDGLGMSPDFLPFVFDSFRQADTSTRGAHGGLGLGLSIVKQLVAEHGGTIRAESEGLGRGATFVLELPVQASPVAPPPAEPPAAPAPGRRQLEGLELVVVDDEPDARELLSKILTAAGATVRTASGAVEALRLLERQPPHVLISDIGMPDVNG